jgi:hypothetical protein
MEQAGLSADPWQAEVLRSAARRMLLLCARQTGKSTTIAVLALHQAIYRARSLILLLSPSLRQSSELFLKVMSILEALPRQPRLHSRSAVTLQLANGSRIISLPSSEGTIRGYSGASLLIIDEASRVADDLYATVRPMLATSAGRLICLSTPWGKRGFFYEAFANCDPSWARFTVTGDQCPRITSEFLEEERRTLNAQWFAQEYFCEFISPVSQVFDRDTVMAAFDKRAYALSWE